MCAILAWGLFTLCRTRTTRGATRRCLLHDLALARSHSPVAPCVSMPDFQICDSDSKIAFFSICAKCIVTRATGVIQRDCSFVSMLATRFCPRACARLFVRNNIAGGHRDSRLYLDDKGRHSKAHVRLCIHRSMQ